MARDPIALIQSYSPSIDWDVTGAVSSPFIERGADNIPRALPMPSKQAMREMTTGELYGICHRYGYIEPLEGQTQMAARWLRGFPETTADPERYARAMERLRSNMRPAVLGTARRMAERHESLRAVDGDTTTMMMYINEADEPCEECEPLGGTEGTYAQFAADGALPGDRCLGGDNCLCTLMRIS